MKALSLTQPWATLVAIGAKKIETRSWWTQYRGTLAIHAAKNFPKDCREVACIEKFWEPIIDLIGRGKFPWMTGNAYPMGAIVATCELVEISGPLSLATSWHGCTEHWKNKHCFRLTENERAFGDYSEGRYIWLLENVKLLPEPIPAKGMLGLWEWDENGL